MTDEKEKWFRSYVDMLGQAENRLAANPAKRTDGLFHCPCCGFPTLDERAVYDICVICWWEDDGQDDHGSNLDKGGPNHGSSLDHARKNFLDHGHMYDLGNEIYCLKKPDKWRDALMEIVRPALESGVAFDVDAFKLWRSARLNRRR
jgi:hypothetical protein